MTAERRKALIYLTITLIIGIFIGSLVPALFGRMRRDGWKERGKMEQKGERRPDRRAGFEKMIYKITKPDSSQIGRIRPILQETSTKIEALEKGSNARMTSIMDSMKIKLQPVLTSEQMKNLEDFSQRTRSKRRGF